MKEIVRVLYRAFRKATPDSARKVLAGASIGVLSATKLLIRLETGGSTVLQMLPEDLDIVDEFSDEVAEEYFDLVAADAFGKGTYNARLGTARFARTEGTLVFRWADPISMDATAPAELYDIGTVAEVAELVLCGMMDLLGKWPQKNEKDQMNAKLAFIIGFTAASKVLMAFWADDPLAGAVETFAELDSEKRFRELEQENGGPLRPAAPGHKRIST